jgi:hypothetical protein
VIENGRFKACIEEVKLRFYRIGEFLNVRGFYEEVPSKNVADAVLRGELECKYIYYDAAFDYISQRIEFYFGKAASKRFLSIATLALKLDMRDYRVRIQERKDNGK